jgi:multimeric flavodoxin WrbA
MKAVILDGSPVEGTTGERIRSALEARLREQGWDVEPVTLRTCRIGACAGDFFCWVRSPGVCNVDDDNRRIAAQLATCDLIVYLTPVTFGGYSSTLKRMVDHQIQNVLPFFAMVDGETHHQQRYAISPDLLAVGWSDAPDADAELVFRQLVRRNAVNFHASRLSAVVVPADLPEDGLAEAASGWLAGLRPIEDSVDPGLPAAAPSPAGIAGVRRAVLLVGSPRTRNSTSGSLGGYLHERLAEQGVETETIYLHTVIRSATRLQQMLDAVEAADLVTLAFPLYVDTLPAPVIEALERIAADRRGRTARPQLFTAIANCGFPEASQTAAALATCQVFAREAGFEWAGALGLGGGEAVAGQPLTGGKTARIRSALDLAAAALAHGQAIPGDAGVRISKPIIPHWAYRLSGTMRWKLSARQYGVRAQQRGRPYLSGVARVHTGRDASRRQVPAGRPESR